LLRNIGCPVEWRVIWRLYYTWITLIETGIILTITFKKYKRVWNNGSLEVRIIPSNKDLNAQNSEIRTQKNDNTNEKWTQRHDITRSEPKLCTFGSVTIQT